MAGFLRRLRRGKAPVASETEEPAPDEETAYPDFPADEEPGEEVPVDEPSVPEPEPAPPVSRIKPVTEPSAIASEASSASTAAMAPMAPMETGPPPPLPKAEEGASSRAVAGGPGAFHSCFLCGTPMDGPWCPTCRMVWND